MTDKIILREINTKTYPHACVLEVDNINHGIRIIMDECNVTTDEVLNRRFDSVSVSLAEATDDPRIAEDAQIAYQALRRIALVKIQDYVDAHKPEPIEEDQP